MTNRQLQKRKTETIVGKSQAVDREGGWSQWERLEGRGLVDGLDGLNDT